MRCASGCRVRFFLANRLVAEEAIGRTGNLAFQGGPGRNRLVVTDIAVSVIRDLVCQFCWSWLVCVGHRRYRGAIVARLQVAYATCLNRLCVRYR